jgi:hypothetical protein
MISKIMIDVHIINIFTYIKAERIQKKKSNIFLILFHQVWINNCKETSEFNY